MATVTSRKTCVDQLLSALRSVFLLPLLVFTLTSMAAADAGVDEAARHSFVFPKQTIQLKFNHELHADEASCDECHKPQADGKRMVLPDHEVCSGCHDETSSEEEGQGECGLCHLNPWPKEGSTQAGSLVQIPASRLNFSHVRHGEKEVKCTDCHNDINAVTVATVSNLPTMETCQDCHALRNGPRGCTACHQRGADGRVKIIDGSSKLLPLGRDRADRHFAGWKTGHATVAFSSSENCLACHREQFCQDCHTAQGVQLVHGPGWGIGHAAKAEGQQHRCQTCHSSIGFCADCHRRNGADRDSRKGAIRSDRYHPEGWLGRSSGARFHGVAARTQVGTCQACHSEKSCIQCHGTRGAGNFGGVSPHPAGFNADRVRRFANDSCLKCHQSSDKNLK